MVLISQYLRLSTKLRPKLQGINRTIFPGLRLLESDRCRAQNAEFIPKRFQSQKLSYVHGVGDTALLGVNIGHFVDESAKVFSDREAIVDVQQNIRKNFVEYKHDIDQFAMGLLSLKLNKGDRFGIWCPNRYEWAVAELAAFKAGLIMVPLNPGYQAPEMEYSLKKVQMRALIIQENFRIQDYYKLMKIVVPEIADTKHGIKIKSAKHPYFDTLIAFTDKDLPGTFKYKDISKAGGNAEKQQLEDLQWKIQCDEPASILFTSGTTGQPKGAVLSHHNLVNGSYTMRNKNFESRQKLRICLPIPLFHAFGCSTMLSASIINGYCLVLPSQGYSAADTLKAMEKEKCTTMSGSPTMFLDMILHPDMKKTDLSSLRAAYVGGAGISPQLTKNITEKMKLAHVMIGYGATETSGSVVANYKEDAMDEVLRSCGWPYDYLECKIIDCNGCIVPLGTSGQICIRGYKVMLGYWGDEEKTKEVITKDGWYKTGDLGHLNENGSLTVVGRMGDMILRGGENIYPREIEDVLMTHPKIADAQVVGIPDERLGEQVCVWIILKPNESMTETELTDFCKDKMAHYKIPHYVKFVEDIPKTLLGKAKKYLIKEEMIKILGLKRG